MTFTDRENIRVLHCPNIVAGNAQNLARSERELGLKSWAISFYQNYLSYQTDEVMLFQITDTETVREHKRRQLFWRALHDFDVIHYNAGETIYPAPPVWPRRYIPTDYLPSLKDIQWLLSFYSKAIQTYLFSYLFYWLELPLLKRAGKCIVVTYQGSDARQGDFCAMNFDISPVPYVEAGYFNPESDAAKRRSISRLDRYADVIYYLNPDLGHVLPARAKFMPYGHIDLRDWKMIQGEDLIPEFPLVIHAPSHRGAKGTEIILNVVRQLQSEGVPFEFQLIEKMSNVEARQLYERADLLIDQLLVGWYGGLAVELMALGKPVMCYIRESDLQFIPVQMRSELPVINVTPDSLYHTLKAWLVQRKNELREAGRRSRSYVETWHNPLRIAKMLKCQYETVLKSRQ